MILPRTGHNLDRGRWAGWVRKVPLPARLALAGVVALMGAAGLSAYLLNRPIYSGPGEREVTVERGMSTRQIGALLEREGLIRSALFFEAAVYFSRARGRIQAGIHEVPGGLTTTGVAVSLTRARDVSRIVTIPEGLTLKEIASLLKRGGVVDSARFVAVCVDPAFCREMGVAARTLEGYLFPETYLIPGHADERRVVRLMVAQFRRCFDPALRARADALRLSVHQAVTLASIVEREARVEKERTLIAGVFHRRLKLGMRLESDPTTEYALGVRKPHLYDSDISVDSPYNTYRYPGLPPGPIASPGRASLVAALYPADAGYLFFVARGDGTHVFSKSKREHDRARAEIRKNQKRQLTARSGKTAKGS